MRRTPRALSEHARKMAFKKARRAEPNYPHGFLARGKVYPSVGAKQIAKAKRRAAVREAVGA